MCEGASMSSAPWGSTHGFGGHGNGSGTLGSDASMASAMASLKWGMKLWTFLLWLIRMSCTTALASEDPAGTVRL